jgi:proteasome lid subunit RPN8/RPN11
LVDLESKAWSSIEAHALSDYPDECCGLVLRDAGGDASVVPCENIQDKLRARDPEEHPRTARTAYRMDSLQVAKTLQTAEEAGGGLFAIYHSHIDCDAYFSYEDQAAAKFFGEPAYPGVSYLVISVIEEKIENRKAFCWSDNSNQFEEVPFFIA